MSSLAAAQADGYYAPPEYYESGAYKKQTRNQFQAKQQQREGGKPVSKSKSSLVVRFELPCSGSCCSCGFYFSKGTRFNATKIRTNEKYFSTHILEFSMKCRRCGEVDFIIRTNPKERGFDYVRGIRKAKINSQPQGTVTGYDGATRDSDNDGAEDALSRLERAAEGQRKTMSETERLEKLKTINDKYSFDSDMNASLRAKFRAERNERKRRRNSAVALGFREGISLSDNRPEDSLEARKVTFGDGHKLEKQKLRKARTSSIVFSKKRKRSASSKLTNRNITESTIQPDPAASSATAISSAYIDRNVAGKGTGRLGCSKERTCTSSENGNSNEPDEIHRKKDPAWSALDALSSYPSDSD